MSRPVVLITGALTGIGRAVALAFADSGARLVISGRRPAEGKALEAELRQLDAEAFFVAADVRHDDEVRNLVDQAVSHFGRLDVAVNNAGTEGQPGPIVDQTAESYAATFDTNVLGTLLSLKHELRVMTVQGSGSVINISSTYGHEGGAFASIYAGSKHAVEGLTKSAALEVAATGVRVNAVAPGPTDTGMLTRFTGTPERKAALSSKVPLARIGKPGDIAAAVLYLASEGAAFVTGQVLTVDGGKNGRLIDKTRNDIMNNALFTLDLGRIHLGHRVVMAPLTRLRADRNGDTPNALMREYYRQRASEGGLIITEATTISPTARGYLGAPGLYTDAQVAGWRAIVDAVHERGGRILAQLWHVGRTSHASLSGGATPVTASVVPYEGLAFTENGWTPASPARALETDEIAGIVADYAAAARRARDAGFDGIEIHAANGYLLDQFLQDGSNRRYDLYGGSIENRSRLLMEVVQATRTVWGDGRTGVRISPSSSFNGMSDSRPDALFAHIAESLANRGLAYLHVVEPRVLGSQEVAAGLQPVASRDLRPRFGGPVIAAGGFDGAEAQAEIARGSVDAVAFGRHFIANPDLPARLRAGLALNPYDRDTFYGGGAQGYTDYPTTAQAA